MAPLSPSAQSIYPDDELDDILNGIAGGRDVNGATQTQTKPSFGRKADTTEGLGIDEEVIIAKKRIPIPKLNDERLLSDPGIPRLRKISKERLRFKGKGHEYGDIARMLNMYQLWLDDLYPRAKFADALAIIEKVGHTKRMQIGRKDWIDEGKPRRTPEQDDIDADEVVTSATHNTQGAHAIEEVENIRTDEKEPVMGKESQKGSPLGHAITLAPSDDPDEDELDTLLAESARSTTTAPQSLPSRAKTTDDDPFADEMEAMADVDW